MEKRTERMYIRVSYELRDRIRKQAQKEGRSSMVNMCEVLLHLGLGVRQLNEGVRLDVPIDDD